MPPLRYAAAAATDIIAAMPPASFHDAMPLFSLREPIISAMLFAVYYATLSTTPHDTPALFAMMPMLSLLILFHDIAIADIDMMMP